jgi:hypothetical protein
MTAVQGVEIERDTNGEVTHISIDVRQHKEAIPVLEELGLIQGTSEKNHTVEEFYSAMVAEINKHYGTNY